MNKVITILSLIIVSSLLCGCPYYEDKDITIKGLVKIYYSTNKLSGSLDKQSITVEFADDNTSIDWFYAGNVTVEYYDLQVRNSDTLSYFYSVDDQYELKYLLFNNRHAFANRLKSISITSDKQWSAKYPPGSSLNDLFIFFSTTPDKYLKNKGVVTEQLNVDKYYNENLAMYDPNAKKYLDPTSVFLPILGKVSEVDFMDYNIMLVEDKVTENQDYNIHKYCMLYPTELPEQPLEIKVVFKFEQGDDAVLIIPLSR